MHSSRDERKEPRAASCRPPQRSGNRSNGSALTPRRVPMWLISGRQRLWEKKAGSRCGGCEERVLFRSTRGRDYVRWFSGLYRGGGKNMSCPMPAPVLNSSELVERSLAFFILALVQRGHARCPAVALDMTWLGSREELGRMTRPLRPTLDVWPSHVVGLTRDLPDCVRRGCVRGR